MQKILSVLLTVVLFILLGVAFLHPSSELSLDLGEHIKFGEIIVRQHFFPTTNLFSYTYPNAPFVHQEFLPDIVFYFLYHLGGINALIMLTTAMVLVAFGLVFFYAYRQVSPIILFAASFLFLRILFERTYVRPEVFSYLFLSIFVIILLTFRYRFTKWIYVLIPLQFLWMNSHIYFVFGLFLLGLALVELLVTKKYQTRMRDIQILTGVFVASCLVCLLNPNGITGVLYPFTLFHNYGFSVQENNSIFTIEQQNPGIIIYSILFFKITAMLLVLFLLFQIKTAGIFSWIAAISFIVLAASAIRNFPLFVFGTFIPFVLAAEKTLSGYREKLVKHQALVVTLSQLILLVIFLWQLGQVISVQGVGLGSVDAAEKGVNFFVSNNLPGPIFNNYGIGSYLVFRLYPKQKVFVDGRPEAYPARFFSQTYIPMQTDPNVFGKVAQQYKFNTIIYDYPAEQTTPSRQFLQSIANNPDWKMVYLDDNVVMLVKDSRQNTALIQKYLITQDSFDLNKPNLSESVLENLAYFFAVVGWDKKETEAYRLILNKDPNNCSALVYTISDLSAHNDPGVIVLQNRYQTLCPR